MAAEHHKWYPRLHQQETEARLLGLAPLLGIWSWAFQAFVPTKRRQTLGVWGGTLPCPRHLSTDSRLLNTASTPKVAGRRKPWGSANNPVALSARDHGEGQNSGEVDFKQGRERPGCQARQDCAPRFPPAPLQQAPAGRSPGLQRLTQGHPSSDGEQALGSTRPARERGLGAGSLATPPPRSCLAVQGKGEQGHRPSLPRFLSPQHRQEPKLPVTHFSIRSTIVSRYAHTQIVSVMTNPHSEAQEAIFDLDLPSLAFISNFTMIINGKVYVAEVKEKHQAKKMYEEARKQGQTAAHVASQDDEVKKFKISTNVAVGGEVTFALTYEELLPRLLGKYQHAVSVRPGQVVSNLSVEVTVSERTGIDYVHVLPLRTSHLLTNAVRGEADLPTSTRIEKEETCARITFTPAPSEQAAYSSRGIMGDFVIQYDVAMKDVIGDVQISDGYFVHYFAPRGLPRMQKNIIFVIDVSGSMTGTKLKQTKKAMHVILGDLCPEDYFNIVTFSDTVHIWKAAGSIQATPPNVQRAKAHIGRMEAGRWTDMNAALLAAASIVNQTSGAGPSGEARLIIFLTDGEPTAGVTSPARILANTRKALAGQAALFGLALGDDADLPLLRRLSLENRGVAHRIREDQDAAVQLKGFYDRISSPLLSDIRLHYQGRQAGRADPAGSHFPNYFGGSELVVVGQLGHGEPELHVHLEAQGPHNRLLTASRIEKAAGDREPAFGCPPHREINPGQSFLRRLWAYVTIQGLLEAHLGANDSATRRLLADKARNLSLHFHFVTPLTSLVVMQPREEGEGQQAPHPTLTAILQPTTTGKFPRPPVLPGPTKPLLQGAKFTTASPGPSSVTKAGHPRATKHNLTPSVPWVHPTPGEPSSVKPTASSLPKTGSLSPPRASPNTHLNSVAPALGTSSQPGALLHPKPSSSSWYNLGSSTPLRSGSSTTPKPSTPVHLSPNILPALNRTLSSPSPPRAVPPASADPSLSILGQSGPNSQSSLRASSLPPSILSSPPPYNSSTPEIIRVLVLPEDPGQLLESLPDSGFSESLKPPAIYAFPNRRGQGSRRGECGIQREPPKSPVIFTFSSSVDGDPHFEIQLPNSESRICFTVDGRAGDTLELISDPEAGLQVSGHLVGAPPKPGHEHRTRTYLDRIVVAVRRLKAPFVIHVSPHQVDLKMEGLTKRFSWDQPLLTFQPGPGLELILQHRSIFTVRLSPHLEFLVRRHRDRHPTVLRRPHLGFYIVNGHGLSHSARGLLGQFQHTDLLVKQTVSGAWLERPRGATVPLAPAGLGQDWLSRSLCWRVKPQDVEKLLGSPYSAFVLAYGHPSRGPQSCLPESSGSQQSLAILSSGKERHEGLSTCCGAPP
ncbi:inter-alpha-trypsin inhibitor heavy chain H6 [Sminthopsis crassicaudata]|uniref:inter-alpha-trypsin inhibitor heavy chain H6 n=1 Tax=Sminthopsis crassicaudata TaxID=9301 RepID=UPI003D6851A0